MASLISHLRTAGGIARTAALQRAGFSRSELSEAVRSGNATRPRKGWIALPEAEPALLQAARRGAVLTCISQAVRLGLWVLAPPEHLHLAAPHRGSHVVRGSGVVHWSAVPIPRAPGALVDPLENVLALVAECQPYEAALVIVDSALNRGLTSIPTLERLPCTSLHQLLPDASPFSDSGLETLFLSRLNWLRVPMRRQVHVLGRRVDLLIGERLVVQIDGKQHAAAQREADMRHDALLRREGFHVCRFGYSLVVYHWEEVQESVLFAVAHGLHLRSAR